MTGNSWTGDLGEWVLYSHTNVQTQNRCSTSKIVPSASRTSPTSNQNTCGAHTFKVLLNTSLYGELYEYIHSNFVTFLNWTNGRGVNRMNPKYTEPATAQRTLSLETNVVLETKVWRTQRANVMDAQTVTHVANRPTLQLVTTLN